MQFDIVLPLAISMITLAIVTAYSRLETKIRSMFEEKEFRVLDALILVAAMTIMVTITILVPSMAIQIMFLAAYSFVLFLFTFIAVERWYIAVLPSIAFVLLYYFFWNSAFRNVFAIAFAVLISAYLGGLFSWTTVLVFAGLITVMDFIQVFITGHMGASAEKLLELDLPILIELPTYPFQGAVRLGLGDIFLTGLLATQTLRRYGRNAAFMSAIATGLAFLLFEITILNVEFSGYFPATLVVVFGWLLGLGLYHLSNKEL